MAQDTVIQIKSNGWKFKAALGAIGLVVIVILATLYRFELGLIALSIGLGYTGKLVIQARHQYRLSQYEARRIEAEVKKLEASSFFVETNTGVFFLENSMVSIASFYPAVSASKPLADVPLLLPPPPSHRKLLAVDFIHLLVTGPSNIGKTTVLCHLIDNAPNDTIVFVLDPHSRFNRWPGRVNEVIGYGRDYQAIDNKLVDLIAEMDRRYNSDRMNFQRMLIITDEWLSTLEYCPNAPRFFNIIGSEARKVSMSLVISSISATVDDLDVSAAIRDNLAQLSLNRTLKSQNLGELKWSKRDSELVELPGPYTYRQPVLPARVHPELIEGVEPVEVDEPLPILDDGPVFKPTANELKIYELYLAGKSLNAIFREVYPDKSYGGIQANELKEVLRKFNVNL